MFPIDELTYISITTEIVHTMVMITLFWAIWLRQQIKYKSTKYEIWFALYTFYFFPELKNNTKLLKYITASDMHYLVKILLLFILIIKIHAQQKERIPRSQIRKYIEHQVYLPTNALLSIPSCGPSQILSYACAHTYKYKHLFNKGSSHSESLFWNNIQ